jgi:hypothetical protein
MQYADLVLAISTILVRFPRTNGQIPNLAFIIALIEVEVDCRARGVDRAGGEH